MNFRGVKVYRCDHVPLTTRNPDTGEEEPLLGYRMLHPRYGDCIVMNPERLRQLATDRMVRSVEPAQELP